MRPTGNHKITVSTFIFRKKLKRGDWHEKNHRGERQPAQERQHGGAFAARPSRRGGGGRGDGTGKPLQPEIHGLPELLLLQAERCAARRLCPEGRSRACVAAREGGGRVDHGRADLFHESVGGHGGLHRAAAFLELHLQRRDPQRVPEAAAQRLFLHDEHDRGARGAVRPAGENGLL